MRERLSKFLARCGVASRRKAEAIVKSGRVTVNNCKVLEPYYEIDSLTDSVTLDDIAISVTDRRKIYVALNKPPEYMSDLADPKGRRIARDLIPISARIYPVGRLDFASEGLIIFTNDGYFANTLLHPSHHFEKEYLVKLQGTLTSAEIGKLVSGRRFEGVLYKLQAVRFAYTTHKNSWYVMTAIEGRNRMIRKLAESLGHRVLKLRRVRIGPVALGSLKPGQFRHLTRNEINAILTRAPQGVVDKIGTEWTAGKS